MASKKTPAKPTASEVAANLADLRATAAGLEARVNEFKALRDAAKADLRMLDEQRPARPVGKDAALDEVRQYAAKVRNAEDHIAAYDLEAGRCAAQLHGLRAEIEAAEHSYALAQLDALDVRKAERDARIRQHVAALRQELSLAYSDHEERNAALALLGRPPMAHRAAYGRVYETVLKAQLGIAHVIDLGYASNREAREAEARLAPVDAAAGPA